jgi:N-acetylmuramoyl-L-alanine amidase
MSESTTRWTTAALWTLLSLAAVPSLSAQARTIVMIDPGHGGDQAGVTFEGLLEKNLVLRTASALSQALTARGYEVRMTRTADQTIANPDRRAAAEAAGAAIMVSLHFNQNADSTRRGVEIYGNLEDAKVTDLANRLATALRTARRPVVIATRSNTFLNSPTVPTVMIEAGFLTNPAERALIESDPYHRELASAIAAGVAAFLSPP